MPSHAVRASAPRAGRAVVFSACGLIIRGSPVPSSGVSRKRVDSSSPCAPDTATAGEPTLLGRPRDTPPADDQHDADAERYRWLVRRTLVVPNGTVR
jgi:hypothetical protein